MTVKENLIAAKALIDTPEKWGKGEYKPSPGCFCAFGALMAARGVDPEDDTSVTDEDRALAKALPSGWHKVTSEVADFNDHPDTTHADIMALFQRAIEAEEAKEARS
jgi:hypothetical protein